MQFKDIIGQQAVKQSLLSMVQSNRMPHAQLFLGPEGSGKLALALAFAQYLLCTDRSSTDSCGVCRHCRRAAKFIHPDLHFTFPVVGSKITSSHYLKEWRLALSENIYLNVNQWLQGIGAENKQGNINKDECVQIIHKLSLKSFESEYKILILWLPEYLAKEGNRLLKIIEEPPENTVFLLVAENADLILNTILSRCQLVKVRPLSDEDLAKALEAKKGLPTEAAQGIAQITEGNYNEALQLAERKQNNNAELFLDWMRKCYLGNGVQLVNWVEKFATLGRENQKHFFRYALHFMREYLKLKMVGQQAVRLQSNELRTANNLLKVIGFDQVEKITMLFDESYYHIERNANPKVLLLDASIQLNKILKRSTESAPTRAR
ncbi:MAG: hypothetical protein AAFO94_03620 [Bacteroidota bacterium]